MSHFSLLVITDKKPTAEVLSNALAPFHEFECTGEDNEYVQSVDLTSEARDLYAKEQVSKLKSPSGEIFCPYEERFYRDPTEEEAKKIGPIGGSGGCAGLIWTSRDWSDGKGYRAKVWFLPEGWEEVHLNTSEVSNFADWCSEYYGKKKVGPNDEVDPKVNKEIKYGWIRINAAGEVQQVIDRTNPNKKWDWWVVGGRWSGLFTPKPEARAKGPHDPNAPEKGRPGLMGAEANAAGVDVIRKGDVDFKAMLLEAHRNASSLWQRVRKITGDLSDFVTFEAMLERLSNDHGLARDAYNSQPARKALSEAARKENEQESNQDLFWVKLEDFMVPQEVYAEKEASKAISTFAVLKDGKWFQRGEMGWWGAVSNEDSEWNENFNRLLSGMPDDVWLTVVDCHI